MWTYRKQVLIVPDSTWHVNTRIPHQKGKPRLESSQLRVYGSMRRLTAADRQEELMVVLLDKLTRLESRFSSAFSDGVSLASHSAGWKPAARPVEHVLPSAVQTDFDSAHGPDSQINSLHMVRTWPSIDRLLLDVRNDSPDLQNICKEGVLSALSQDLLEHRLPLACCPEYPGISSTNSEYSCLTAGRRREYTNAYFQTYSKAYPILEKEQFVSKGR